MGTKIVWLLFAVIVGLTIVEAGAKIAGVNLRENTLFYATFIPLPVILMFLHSVLTLSLRRGLFFISLSFFIGLVAEIEGVKHGTVFGGQYVYKEMAFMIKGVPLIVPFYWAAFIYTGYSIVNSFLEWMYKEKPSIKNNLLFLLPILIILDGDLVVAIDLFMDPLEVRAGSWTWLNGGPYFGVPIGNFVGWFFVTILTTTIFRVFEYFKPYKPKVNPTIYLIPVLGYGVLCISFLVTALSIGLQSLALIGSFLMMPVTVINIMVYTFSKINKHR